MTWVTNEQARALNPDLDTLDVDELGLYLDAAFEACAAFLPRCRDGVEVDYTLPAEATASRKLAQVMQAAALWKSTRSGPGNEFGAGEFTVTVFPMDWTVKALLRPKRGKPVIR